MNSGELFALCDAAQDEASFVRFVDALVLDREASDSQSTTVDGHQGEWANQSIAQFLEAAAAWAKDSGFGDRPGPKPTNSWRQFAQFLWAGRGYE